jgi:hypothetical protein
MIRTILLVLIASAVAGCAMQQQQEDATKEEVTAGFALFQQVWEGPAIHSRRGGKSSRSMPCCS